MTPRFLLVMFLCLSFDLHILRVPALNWENRIFFGSLPSSSLFKWPVYLKLRWVSISYMPWSLDFSRMNLFWIHCHHFCASDASNRCEAFGHPICLPSKLLRSIGGLRKLWSGILHIYFLWKDLYWTRIASSAHKNPWKHLTFVYLVLHLVGCCWRL